MSRFISIPIVVLGLALAGFADSITLTGVITQSQNDQPGNPAINNPTLNNINDGEAYSLALNFAGSITSPGSFALTGGLFSDPNDPAGNATESGFGSGTLVITQSAGVDTVAGQLCLTGFVCNTGNELDLNFKIPASGLNGSNVVAQGIPGLLPLDLLEDGGSTDIHASVTSYSYMSSVPEPSSLVLLVSGITAFALRKRRF